MWIVATEFEHFPAWRVQLQAGLALRNRAARNNPTTRPKEGGYTARGPRSTRTYQIGTTSDPSIRDRSRRCARRAPGGHAHTARMGEFLDARTHGVGRWHCRD